MPTKTSTNPKTLFCSGLEWKEKIEWFDLTGILKIDKERRAVITLDTHGTHGHYPGFAVSIVGKNEGRISYKYFRFDDYLSKDKRADNRNDYPLGGNGTFMVIDHCGWKWYIAVPVSSRPVCEAIETWINVWK